MTEWKWAYSQPVQDFLRRIDLRCENLGLMLDKFTPIAHYTWQTRRRGQQSGWGIGPEGNKKTEWLKEAVDGSNSDAQRAAMGAQIERWIERVEARTPPGETLCILPPLVTASPLIMGLGSKHVLETAITLDRNTGAPVIPGSALKGLARTVAVIELAQKLPFPEDVDRLAKVQVLDDWLMPEDPSPDDLQKKVGIDRGAITDAMLARMARLREVFGFVGGAGRAVFFEGVCVQPIPPRLSVDIMNPHYGKYYGKNEPPRDDDNPVPVTFLTVRRGQQFAFAVVPRQPDHAAHALQARKWLFDGLTMLGIGGKTSQGYGLFKRG